MSLNDELGNNKNNLYSQYISNLLSEQTNISVTKVMDENKKELDIYKIDINDKSLCQTPSIYDISYKKPPKYTPSFLYNPTTKEITIKNSSQMTFEPVSENEKKNVLEMIQEQVPKMSTDIANDILNGASTDNQLTPLTQTNDEINTEIPNNDDLDL